MRNRRTTRTPSQDEAYEPQEATVPDSPAVPVEEPQEPVLAVQEAETDEPWVNPRVLAAQQGEQVEFGSDIVPVAPTDTQE